MESAHMLALVSCVVLACGGGCFESLCTPSPAPAAAQPAGTGTLIESPELPAQATVAQPAVAQAPEGAR